MTDLFNEKQYPTRITCTCGHYLGRTTEKSLGKFLLKCPRCGHNIVWQCRPEFGTTPGEVRVYGER